MCKNLIYFVSLVLVLSAALTSTANAEIIGWWRLDEGSGTTVTDLSEYGNNGTLQGDPQWVNGKFGKALQFNGIDEFVEIPHADILTVDNEVTVMAWINAERHGGPDTEGWQGIVAKSNSPRSYSLYTETNGGLHFSTTSTVINDYVGTVSSAQVPLNEWVHVAAMVVEGQHQYYINGEPAGTSGADIVLPGIEDTSPVLIGRTGEGATRSFLGMIDDVRIYNEALTQEEIQVIMLGAGMPYASGPSPGDGVLHEDTWASLSWHPGDDAASHDVYFGENFNDVTDGAEGTFHGNQTSTYFVVGFPGFPYSDGLVPGTTYYWRVDELEADGTTKHKGNVWSFMVPPKTAYYPDPADGAESIDPEVELNWTAGFGAKLHYAYFGDNFDDVNSAAGGLPQATTTFTPGTLELEKTYYWRVDEFDAIVTHKGDVWSFKTLPDIPITDPNLVGWWTLDEGMGTTALDWSGYGNHGTFEGDPQWVPGYDGDALEFDGDDYVDTGNTEDLANWTITAWVISPEAPSSDSPSGPLHREQNYQFNWYHSNDVFRGAAAINAGGAWHAAKYMPLAANTWYHLAATYDGNVLKAYRDGVLITSNPAPSGPANAEGNSMKLGRHAAAAQFFTGTVDDARVYDEALTQEEIQQVMRGDTSVAWSPSPGNGSTPDIDEVMPLSWSPGDNASEHDVYFGTVKDTVANADETDTTGIYRGRQSATSYNPPEGVEWGGGPYYWRIDEYNTDGTIKKGRIWSFMVNDFLTVDDFEDYDVGNNEIWWAWIDGLGYASHPTLPAHPGNGTGSMVGDETTGSYMEETIVHGGGKSMPFFYGNNQQGKLRYSEVEKTLSSQRDWTKEGVGVLSLWFYGDASNAAEPMYVALNGNAVVTHDNPNAVQIDTWTEWPIDLQSFADQGVNLANVNTIAIGLGNKKNPVAGGSGVMYIDDIRLYRPAP